jgi:SNF2 family DNA or RNA helicase
LLAHPASAAYGLNLQKGGNHVIWFGLNWSLELYQQANKRLHRQGQTEKVIIHHLVTENGVDEDVIAALEDKGATQSRLMDALKARIEKVNRH